MQASKIVIGKMYAIRLESGDLARFQVHEVVQRRVSNHGNPHDYKSHVVGYIREGASLEENADTGPLNLHPERILGPYDEHVELVARADAEKAAKKKEEDDLAEKVHEVWRLLYAGAGINTPNDPSNYKQPFTTSWGRSVEIRSEGIPLILDFLRKAAKERTDA